MNSNVCDLLADLERGHRRALARLLTVVENGEPDDVRLVAATVRERAGNARVIGLTGPPGVGKSTLTSALVSTLRGRNQTVAVLAVDPSSPFSGGALLGDRVRMQTHHGDSGVFIRSMATRGHLGGMSLATIQALDVLDAAGFDVIVIETVGVGQSEVEVATAADTTVVVLTPGLGDAVQAAKAGVLEAADVLVVNRADQPGVGKTVSELRGMLQFDTSDRPRVRIVRTVAVRSEGTTELLEAIDEHNRWLVESGARNRRRQTRAAHAVREIVLDRVRRQLDRLDAGPASPIARIANQVADGSLDPWAAADQLIVRNWLTS